LVPISGAPFRLRFLSLKKVCSFLHKQEPRTRPPARRAGNPALTWVGVQPKMSAAWLLRGHILNGRIAIIDRANDFALPNYGKARWGRDGRGV